MRRAILAALALSCAAALATVPSAGARQEGRCHPSGDGRAFAYSCPAAFPESFTLAGSAPFSRFRFSWSVLCGHQGVSGIQTDGGLAVKVYAGRFSKPGSANYDAWRLMENSRVCTISVAGRRVSGSHQFHGELVINVNHPEPII